MTYGDVAEFVGFGSGRVVGSVLSRYGHEVAWWRVVLSTGRPAPGHAREALERLASEGVPMRSGGERVDLAGARWDGRV
jgi:methylated-DNA-protein-cysteine methyltransferase-like protein